jgi:hypothetical protein
MDELRVNIDSSTGSIDAIRSADYAVVSSNSQPPCPRPKAVNDKIVRPTEFVANIGFGLEHGHGDISTRHDAMFRGDRE